MGSRPSPEPPNLVVRVRTLAPHRLSGRIDAHGLKIALHIARRLADSMLVLHHRDANEALPLHAIADAGRDRDLGMGEKLLGKLQAAQMGERRGQWRPAEHRRARHWHLPTGSEEHTSELQSLMRTPYAGFCLKKKKIT